MNSAVLKLLNQSPLPNDDTSGDGFNTSGYRFKASTPLTWNTYIAKGTHGAVMEGTVIPHDIGGVARIIRNNSTNYASAYPSGSITYSYWPVRARI